MKNSLYENSGFNNSVITWNTTGINHQSPPAYLGQKRQMVYQNGSPYPEPFATPTPNTIYQTVPQQGLRVYFIQHPFKS